MSTTNFYSKFGIFVEKNFFEPELCSKLIENSAKKKGIQGAIHRKGKDVLDEYTRKSKIFFSDEEEEKLVDKSLEYLKPKLESFFGVDLTGHQQSRVLQYKEGDFFSVHLDKIEKPGTPEIISRRKISIVVFLNSESESLENGDYVGGGLILYGLTDIPPFNEKGFRMIGEQGTLVAFRSEVAHEVTKVEQGERYTFVCFYV